jgi:hypothetical protein
MNRIDHTNYAFLDESGKFHDRDFICLCGYLSAGDKWDVFMERWQTLLATVGLPAIHMNNFYHECKKLGLDEVHANQILEKFIDIIRDTINIGFAVGLDADYYRTMPESAKRGIGDPAVACLQRLLNLVRERFVAQGHQDRISVTFDEDESSAIEFYKVTFKLRKRNPELGKLIGAVCFADDGFIIPLQAADILANLTSKWFKDRLTGKASETEVPALLRRLLMAPEAGFGLEYKTELWNAKELHSRLDTFIQWDVENQSKKNPEL